MTRRGVAATLSALTLVTSNSLSPGTVSAGQDQAPVAAPAPAQASASRVLVMPFDAATRDPRSYWLAEASSVILSDSLLRLGMPVMRRDERLHSFELLRVPAVSGLSQATIIRVGQVVGASQVIVGSFSLAADTLAVQARAIQLDTGMAGPEISESGPLVTIFDIYDRLAVRLVPGASTTGLPPDGSHPPLAAFEQFIKGLIAEMPATRLAFLNEAIRHAPELHRARLAMWDVHHDLGNHEAALATVKAVPPGHRLSRQARFLASVSLLELRRYDDAFNELTRLNAEEADATLLNNLGVVQLRRPAGSGGPRAVSYFNEAAGLDGVDSFFNLGYAYWLDGDASAAVGWLREAVRRNPADHEAHFVLAVALAATGSQIEAGRERDLAKRLSSVYDEWETKSPSSPVPRDLERLRMDLGMPAALRIENVITEAGQRDQRQLASFHLEAARRAYEADRDAQAISQLQRAVYLSPYDYEAHLLLGRVYLRGGRLPDAIDALKISIWSNDGIEARVVLAEAYEKAGMPADARTELQAVLTRDPSHADARQRLERLAGR